MSYGQTEPSRTSRNNAYLELLGNGGLYSVNYERIVAENFALRLGFAAFKAETLFGEGSNSIVTVPVLGNFLFGKKKSKFEVGAGFLLGRKKFASSFLSDDNTNSSIIDLKGVIGYRYQPSTAGFMFRVGLTPFNALKGGDDAYPSSGFFLSGGLSIGYSF
ncbi:hypothetical protein [Pontibacter saemangeumensis]|uniref:hypothetical protein n=1 Tax=Pontibacter saemangeumensis TaxID=1084525 RepID=UPI0031EB6E01